VLGLLVVGLDGLLGGDLLLDVASKEVNSELGVGRVLVANAEPEEVGNDRDDVVPVDDQKQVHKVEGLGNRQPVEGDGLVGLDLVQDIGNSGWDVEVEGFGKLRDDLYDLESGRHDQSGENDCIDRREKMSKVVMSQNKAEFEEGEVSQGA
jgi:hypothetical protein